MQYFKQTLLRRLLSSRNFSKDCGWEYIIQRATCKREPQRYDNAERLGLCLPGTPEKEIVTSDEITDLSPISGVPDAYKSHTALVGRRPKHAMQSGTANTHSYVLSYAKDIEWENPTMGWTSGSNSHKDVEISFPDAESAVMFAQKNGWENIIENDIPKPKKYHVRPYAENFAWQRRTRVSTK